MNLFYRWIASMCSPEQLTFGRELATYQAPKLYFLIITLLCVFLFFKALKRLSIGARWEQNLFYISLLVSMPLIFALERGNSILLLAVFLIGFLVLKDHPKSWIREVSFILLAIAANMKLYPAIFGLLLLQKKRFKDIIHCLLWGILLFIVPFFWHGGVRTIPVLFKNISAVVDTVPGYGYQVGLSNLGRYLHYLTNSEAWEVAAGISRFFFAAFLLIAVFFVKTEWKRLASLSLFCIMIPDFSYLYSILLLVPALALFLKQSPRGKLSDGFHISCFAGLFAIIPVNLAGLSPAMATDFLVKVTTNMLVADICIILLAMSIVVETIIGIGGNAYAKQSIL